MKIINVPERIGCTVRQYPDGQPHVLVDAISQAENVKVICPIKCPDDLFLVSLVSSALDGVGAEKCELHIPYLMAARFDRRMEKGDSFDLEVVSYIINMCGFNEVHLYDVHSDVSLRLIRNSVPHTNKKLVESYDGMDSVLLVPDKGARAKAELYPGWNSSITNVVQCDKVRDLSNGKITLTVLEPEKCEGRNCVIVDDLCDGGGTFLAIAGQISPKSLTLIVTHGIFSRGLECLEHQFDRIITTDSFSNWFKNPSSKLTTIPVLSL